MASGAHDQHRQPPGDPRPGDAAAPDSPPADNSAPPGDAPREPGAHRREPPPEPRIRHHPPGPTDDRARGLPLTSPWGMPPFAAPTQEDETREQTRGRRPYSSPTAEPEARPRRRRPVPPDKLVFKGPARPIPRPAKGVEPSPPGEGAGKAPGPPAPEAGEDTTPIRDPSRGLRTRRDARMAPYGIGSRGEAAPSSPSPAQGRTQEEAPAPGGTGEVSAPGHTTPATGAPDQAAPRGGTPYGSSEQGVPARKTPYGAAGEPGTPGRPDPEGGLSFGAAAGRIAGEAATPGHTSQEGEAPYDAAAGRAAGEAGTLGRAVPEGDGHEGDGHEGDAVERAGSGRGVAGPASPGGDVLDPDPEGATPLGAASEGVSGAGAVTGRVAGEGEAVGHAAPEGAVESAAPGRDAAGSAASGGDARDGAALRGRVPYGPAAAGRDAADDAGSGADVSTSPGAEADGQHTEGHEQEDPGTVHGDGPVRRLGRPPGGRPARPDLLVATGPPRQPGGGRHQRGPAPAAYRRAGPMRARRSPVVPIAISLAIALLVAAGVVVWSWRGADDPQLRLATGTGRSGDELFTVPAAARGTDQKLNDVAADGKAVVVVGSDTTSPTPRPLFLYSEDGKSWQLGRVAGASAPIVRRVAAGGGRWIAAGGDGAREIGLWTSSDGLNWQASGSGAAFRDGDMVHDVARTRSGFVAAGETALRDGDAGPAVWYSADGLAWQRAETRGLEAGAVRAVVADGDTVVAVARDAQGDGSRVIRSGDGGRTWQATGFQLPGTMSEAGSLAVASKRFVLVPTRQRTITGDVRVYCSPGGADWSQCGMIDDLPAASPGVERLVSYEDGVAAVSQAGIGAYAVLTSTDGRSWRERPGIGDLAGATMRGFAIGAGGTMYAAGDRAVSDVDNEPVLMSVPQRGKPARVPLDQVPGLSRMARETSGLASHEGRFVAVGSAAGEAAIWTTQDWKDWTSIGLGGPRRQRLDGVAHGRRGWLAVGASQADLQVTEPLLVSSTDGREWKKVALSDDLARPADHAYLDVRAVAAGPDGYLLAGEDRGPQGTAAAVWFTRDLRAYTRSKRLPQSGSGVRLHDVAATPDGYVAVGGVVGDGGESGVVWVSQDGLNWTARDRVAPPDAASAGLRQVVVHDGRLVVTGTARTTGGASRVFSAVSEDDGVTWETSWLPAERAAGVHDLAAGEQGLVAVGWHGDQGEGDSAAWISQDGLSWSRLDLREDGLAGAGAQWLAAVTLAGEDVVALGRSTTYRDDHLILWRSTLTAGR